MELQTYHFGILEVHSTVNSAHEYEPDVLNTFLCNAGLKTQNFTKNYELISAFATQKFCSF